MRHFLLPTMLILALFSTAARSEFGATIPPLANDQPKGCVSGSIGRTKGEPWDTALVSLRMAIESEEQLKKKPKLGFAYAYSKPESLKNDFNTTTEFGNVFMFCLKPGTYYITGITADGMFEDYISKNPFKIPFKVESGTNTYIGSFSLVIDSFKDGRVHRLRGLSVDFADNSARDFQLLSTKYPTSPAPKVQLIDVSQGGDYFKLSKK